MNQFTQIWNKLNWNQRIWIAAATLAVIGGLVEINHWNQERDFKPLLTGLAAEDAGTVTAKLRELNVDYRLADNGSSILVPTDKVAETRLQLASAGLPKSGRIGFELFDKTNFGASEFAEQVNYHRAIEGELERSVMSIREVEQARVHITMAKDSLYTEQREPAKASVLVKLRSAAPLSPLNIAAICQLTASAVPGLTPDQVSLVDTNGNLLNRPRAAMPGDESDASEGALEYRKSIEKDVQAKIAQTLEPLLGAEHFRAGVSAEVDLTSGDESEELYNPDKSVIAQSQTTQDGPAVPSSYGVPGTASNLAQPHFETLHRLQQLRAPHRKCHLPEQPPGQTHPAAAGDPQAAVALRAGGSQFALGWSQAHRRSAFGREAESDPRPGGRRYRIEYRSRRSTGGRGVPV